MAEDEVEAQLGPDEGHADAGTCVIWPGTEETIALFVRMRTQWRKVGSDLGPVAIGLDYGALEPTAALAGIDINPQRFEELRLMEAEAIAVWARQRKQAADRIKAGRPAAKPRPGAGRKR